MKRITGILLSVLAIFAVSCRKEPLTLAYSIPGYDTQKGIIASGTWKLTWFTENGINVTPGFNTYLFRFDSDGYATANSNE